eukprot:853948_1
MSTLEDEQDTESVIMLGTPANGRSENNDKQNKQTIVGMRIIAGTIIIIVVIIAYFLLRDVFAIKNIIDSNCKAHYDDCNGCRCAEDRYSNTDYNDMDYNDTDYNDTEWWSECDTTSACDCGSYSCTMVHCTHTKDPWCIECRIGMEWMEYNDKTNYQDFELCKITATCKNYRNTSHCKEKYSLPFNKCGCPHGNPIYDERLSQCVQYQQCVI